MHLNVLDTIFNFTRSTTIKNMAALSTFMITAYLSTLFMVMAFASNEEVAREIIMKWWERMSVKKPVKCSTNPEYLEEFHSAAQPFLPKELYDRAIIRTGPCVPNAVSNYKFKVKRPFSNTHRQTFPMIIKDYF